MCVNKTDCQSFSGEEANDKIQGGEKIDDWEYRMIKDYQMTVFCDNCSMLAVATIDDAPLCIDCLLAELQKSADPDFFLTICPLEMRMPKQGKDTETHSSSLTVM